MIASLLLLSSIFASTASAYNVRCWGHNTRTHAYVDGYCSNGTFRGTDWDTRNWVSGSCFAGGSLNAYDTQTRDWVTGQCDRAPLNPLDEAQINRDISQ